MIQRIVSLDGLPKSSKGEIPLLRLLTNEYPFVAEEGRWEFQFGDGGIIIDVRIQHSTDHLTYGMGHVEILSMRVGMEI